MTSTSQKCPVIPKRAKELKKEWQELHDSFEAQYTPEEWEDFHKDEGYCEEPEKKKFKEKQSFLMRIRRANSWLDIAQQMEKDEKETDKDLAPQCIFLWIAFNALYGRDPHRFLSGQPRRGNEWIEGDRQSEKKEFENYFQYLLNSGNAEYRIYKIITGNLSKNIISLSKNKFVKENFWNSHHDIFKKIRWRMDPCLPKISQENTKKTLVLVFRRLYVLRNQLMHGASTWDGRLNMEQLVDGAEIMHCLVPVFIEIMLETPEDEWKKWGRVWFPRVAEKPIL